jgi:hypothetical protein
LSEQPTKVIEQRAEVGVTQGRPSAGLPLSLKNALRFIHPNLAMIDSVSHFYQKKLRLLQLLFEVPRNLGEIDLGSRASVIDSVIRFSRFKSPHALMLASPASEARVLDIYTSKDADLTVGRCQAEIESLAVENEERKARRVCCKQAVREREHAEQSPGFLLEGPQHAQYSPNEGHGELKLSHFECKGKVE